MTGEVKVDVTDDDTPALTVPSTTVALTEGGAAGSFTVKLATQPTGTVTVSVTSDDTGAVTVDTDSAERGLQSTLTFTAANWNAVQTVTVTAADDDDASDESVTVDLAATGGDYADLTSSVSVTVDDDDTPALTVPSTTVALTEGGAAGSFTVRLATQPTDTVTVTVTSGDTGAVTVDTDSAESGRQSSLTFTTANWNAVQNVTVAAVDDDDGADESLTVSLSATGADYAGVTGSVSVTVDDDDTPALTVPSTTVALTEGGAAGSFTVKLATQPTGTVTVSVTSDDTGAVTVDTDSAESGLQSTLTFTAANWDTERTVAVMAPNDDDTVDESVTVDLAATGGDYADLTSSVSVTVDDDDTPALTVPSTTVALTEGGAAGSFTVRLATQPTDTVTVTVTSGDPGAATVDTDPATSGLQSTLSFTTANWNAVQNVTVAAVDDDDGAHESLTVSLSAAGAEYAGVTGSVTVNVTDDEPDPALTVSATSVSLIEDDENDKTGTFTVALAVAPTTDVTVTLTSGDPGAATVDTDPATIGLQSTLSFTTANWNVAQTVTVAAVADGDGADESLTVSLSASGAAEYASVTGSVSVEVDDDEPGLKIDPTSLELTEDDDSKRTGTFNVSLESQPTTTVTVTVASGDTDAVTVDTDSATKGDQSTLTFTSANWNAAQTVTVTALGDSDGADESVTVSLSGKGNEYDDETGTVLVTVDDDEVLELALDPTSLTLKEGTSGSSFTVTLSVQPTTTVTVSVVSDDLGAATVDTDSATSGLQSTLTFTPSNWKSQLEVTVTPVDDPDGADETVKISLTADENSGEYAGLEGEVIADVGDDEILALTVPATPVSVTEGGTAGTFAVALSVPPKSADVTVTVTSGDTGAVTVDTDPATIGLQSTLTFTTSNWNVAQSVTVAAVDDDDGSDESVTVSLSAAGAEYAGVKSSVTVNVTDDETPSLTVPTTPVSVTEGGRAGTFAVALSIPPKSADVTVTLTSGDPGAATVDTDPATSGLQSTLTFTTANWDTPQSVTVAAVDDDDGADESLTVSLSAAGAEYAGVTGSVTVNVTDDETPSLTVPATPVSVTEGGAAVTFAVALSVPPKSADVTVTLTSGDPGAATIDTDPSTIGLQSSLTFTTANWNVAQSVTVAAVDDDDGSDESVTVSLSAAGAEYAGVTGSVTVNVTDDETPSLTVPATPVSVTEGGAAVTFAVALSVPPKSADVTVTLTSGDPGAATIDTDPSTIGLQSSLTFTTANWNVAQSVTVAAVDDDDGSDESVTVSLSAAGAEYAGVTGSVTVNVTDDETPSLTVPATPVSVTEGGAAVTFAVALSVPPKSADVTVTLTSGDPGAATIDTDPSTIGLQSSLTFTTANWNVAQSVTVAAVDDDDGSDESVTVSLSAAGAEYAGVTGSVTVNVTDDETPSLTVPATPVSVTEGGAAVTFAVALSVPPKSADVTVDERRPWRRDDRH